MFYVSYFYQIRFFPKDLIPVSTAIYDPKWYHNFRTQDYVFYDKRGVLNGVRCNALAPLSVYKQVENKCVGRGDCEFLPEDCEYLGKYKEYLDTLNFEDTLMRIEKSVHKIVPNSDICLMVHEKYDNPCSERVMLQRWFNEHNLELKEWVNSEE